MGRILRQSIVMLGLMTVLTGVIYPLVVTGIAQVAFPYAANGSVIARNGKAQGSELIGQMFSDPEYFWSRPSATAPFADNSASSAGSNLGPTNPALAEAVKLRIEALRAADPGNGAPVAVDLVTASASGLDPQKAGRLLMILAPIVLAAIAHHKQSTGASSSQVTTDLQREAQAQVHAQPHLGGILGSILNKATGQS